MNTVENYDDDDDDYAVMRPLEGMYVCTCRLRHNTSTVGTSQCMTSYYLLTAMQHTHTHTHTHTSVLTSNMEEPIFHQHF